MTLEEEFILATQRWYEYVGKDHHKDIDCHWFVDREKIFSYGQPSTDHHYRLWHDGYILDDIDFVGETEDEVFKQGIEFIDNWIKNDKGKTD